MRLIDADKLKADFIGKRYGVQAIEYVIDQQPTVEIVRCKDCRYYDAENHNCLDEMEYARIWNEDDYCSFAERREDETN